MVGAARLAVSAAVGLAELLGFGRAKGRIFKVTPKGSQITASSDRLVFAFFLGLTLLTLGAMIFASWSVPPSDLTTRAPVWLLIMASYNLLHFLIAMVLVEDRPRRRAEERFRIDSPMQLRPGPRAPWQTVQVLDMSLSGVRFQWTPRAPPLGTRSELSLEVRGHALALHELREAPGHGHDPSAVEWVARLQPESSEQTSAVIQHLFSGEFKPMVEGKPGWLAAMRQTARAIAGA